MCDKLLNVLRFPAFNSQCFFSNKSKATVINAVFYIIIYCIFNTNFCQITLYLDCLCASFIKMRQNQ